VAFNLGGGILASGSLDQTVRLWDAATRTHLRTIEGHTNYVLSVAFSPDGGTLASGSQDAAARLWDAATGDSVQSLEGHTNYVTGVAFGPDGRSLASGSWDGTVLLWNLIPAVNTNTSAIVSLSPASVPSPAVGEHLTLILAISGGEKVAGYQATVQFDASALFYFNGANADYLPAGAFAGPAVLDGNRVTFTAAALSGESNGDGTLATLTFGVLVVKSSVLELTEVVLTDRAGAAFWPQVENAQVTEPPVRIPGDVNQDGVVNIQDLVIIAGLIGQKGKDDADINGDGIVNVQDLVLVAGAIGNAAAPSIGSQARGTLNAADVEGWLTQARLLGMTTPQYLRGIALLQQLLIILTPKETVLLPNYPNPFNPETWIPFQLSVGAVVEIYIYDAQGGLTRRLNLGHLGAGFYTEPAKAAYWDGRNAHGEPVASGVYFHQLRTGDYSQVRRMAVVK
jgi:hypothetical protein